MVLHYRKMQHSIPNGKTRCHFFKNVLLLRSIVGSHLSAPLCTASLGNTEFLNSPFLFIMIPLFCSIPTASFIIILLLSLPNVLLAFIVYFVSPFPPWYSLSCSTNTLPSFFFMIKSHSIWICTQIGRHCYKIYRYCVTNLRYLIDEKSQFLSKLGEFRCYSKSGSSSR